MSWRGQEAVDHPDEVRLAAVHARLNGVLWELFELLCDLDTEEAQSRNAMTDAVGWLQFHVGITPKTARAWVRAAHALVDLPLIAAAFRAGEVSLDEVLVLCRYATADTEATLLSLTREVGVEDLAAEIRHLLGTPPRGRPEREAPVLWSWWDEQAVLHLRGSIPGADGVLVETALLRLGAKAPLDPESGLFRDPAEWAGEALVQLASESTAEDRDHDRATMVVHITLEELTTAEPDDTFNLGGSTYTAAELLRLCCDGRIQPAIDHHGVTVGIGRVSRQIPPWLGRLIIDRDGGCRFPSCARTRWTHAHHIHHWAHGGPTNLDNLITLCGWHHRLVHNQGWEITGNPNGNVVFLNRWGTPHQPARSIQPGWQDLLVHQIEHTYTPHLHDQLATANAPPRTGRIAS